MNFNYHMYQSNIILFLSLLIFAYLLGSIPFGLILVRIFKSMDVREIGSGNIGATNVRRAAGWCLGLITLALDGLKGAVPVYIAASVAQDPGSLREIWISLVALTTFFGHLFPVYLKFKTGGKGVATAAGCFAVLSWPALAIAVFVFVFSVALSKRVSMGSMSAAAILPLCVVWAERSIILAGCALIMSMLVFFRHQDNIRRLMAGTEPPLWGE